MPSSVDLRYFAQTTCFVFMILHHLNVWKNLWISFFDLIFIGFSQHFFDQSKICFGFYFTSRICFYALIFLSLEKLQNCVKEFLLNCLKFLRDKKIND